MATEESLPRDRPVITVFRNRLLMAGIGLATAMMIEGAMAQNQNPPNTMGDIHNNRGIITQGQVGNNTIVNPIRREANGVYQGDQKIGNAPPPVVDEATEFATFQAISFTAFPDQTKPLEYGDLLLSAEGTPQPRPNTFYGSVSIAIAGFRAKVIGRR